MDSGDPFRAIDILIKHDVPFVSLGWLRRMKQASGRPKDRIDLDNLPGE